jgi:hypothetical protein
MSVLDCEACGGIAAVCASETTTAPGAITSCGTTNPPPGAASAKGSTTRGVLANSVLLRVWPRLPPRMTAPAQVPRAAVTTSVRHRRAISPDPFSIERGCMTAIRVSTEPLVARSQDGTVHVQLDDDTWAVFRTEAHYVNWREFLDREQIGHDQSAYWSRVQELRTEREALR